MIITRRYIQDLREKSFIDISEDTEKLILEKFGQDLEAEDNGDSHEYSEQDIWEQIRKMIQNN